MFCYSTCKPTFLHAKRGQSKADTKGMVLQEKSCIFFFTLEFFVVVLAQLWIVGASGENL